MIEDIVGGALGTLLAQGTGWVIAVLLGLWVYVLDQRMAKMAAEADKAIKEQYEKRIVEFREIIEVVSNSTQSVNAMQGSVTASSEAINQLAQGFAKLLNEFQNHQFRWQDRGEHMAKQLDDLQRKLEALHNEVRAV